MVILIHSLGYVHKKGLMILMIITATFIRCVQKQEQELVSGVLEEL